MNLSLRETFREQCRIQRRIARLFLETFKRIPQARAWRKEELTQAIVDSGVGSLPLVVISTSFAGVLVTHEIAWHMDRALHTVAMIPGFTGQFILREVGVAIPALLLVSKMGASITAEVGSMKVTEQIDALKLLGIDPIDYLVFPRFIGSILSGACLTVIASAITLGCAILMATLRYHFSLLEYLNALKHFVGVSDLACALVKGSLFGAVIPIIACGYGFECQSGAQGVGNATTNSVVTATVAVIFLDFLVTYGFTSVFT
jgi:phospholipid/cholesterol/gamma-HCH transport system permease protein